MSNVLFLGVPSHGHVNPTIGLVHELVRRGETVTYFASDEFRDRIEGAGAAFRRYSEDLDIFKPPRDRSEERGSPLLHVVRSSRSVIEDVLAQTRGQRFDYLVHSAAFPLTKPLAQILQVPTVSSLAVFLGLDFFFRNSGGFGDPEIDGAYGQAARELSEAYGVRMPEGALGLIFNPGDLNLVYTSRYFASELPYFDETFKFVGPPVFDRKEELEFPWDRVEGKKLLYISLGTVFGGHAPRLYDAFFEGFGDWDGVVVLAAYRVDRSGFDVPDNFVVRNYVPQNAILRRASAAITHCGMNSMNDLLMHEVPFVSLPMGADQPLLAARAQALGATIVLDAETAGPKELRGAVETVMRDPAYLANIRKIDDSFREAGGYPRAVDEIFRLKRARGIAG